MKSKRKRVADAGAVNKDLPKIEDKRRQRGARSRLLILNAAVDLASLDGLEGLSFGRLATYTSHSKAGIQTLFGSKESLQMATVRRAEERFTAAVIAPTAGIATGVARFEALMDYWISYVTEPLFAGGCFWVATRAEQDSRPGPVRDVLKLQHDAWLTLLAEQIRIVDAEKPHRGCTPELMAFEIDAVLSAVNIAVQAGDKDAVDNARRLIELWTGHCENTSGHC